MSSFSTSEAAATSDAVPPTAPEAVAVPAAVADSAAAAAPAVPAAPANPPEERAPAGASPQGKQEETSVAALGSKFSQTALLDMVFVMDATGSMGSYIASAQQTIKDIVQEIVSTEKADVRFALVSYRDHPPQDSSYVTTVNEFTKSTKTMRQNLDALSAQGGGDGPEAVVDGLHQARKLDYRSDATKVCILIADAPPHGLDPSGDGFPNGCPCGLDPLTVCRQMAEDGITLYCIGCEPALTRYKSFFMAMCAITGGQYCPMGSASVLSSAVVSGVREEISLERCMGDIRAELAKAADMDEVGQARYVQAEMSKRGVKTRQMRSDGAGSSAMTADAVTMSKAATLDEARKHFTPTAAAYGAPGGAGSAMRAMAECAAPRGGFLASLSRSVGRKMSSMRGKTEASRCEADACAVPCAAPAAMMYASAPEPADTPSAYNVVEDSISMEQCSRMINKSKMRKA